MASENPRVERPQVEKSPNLLHKYFQMRNISLEDGKNLAQFFNVSFPVWLRKTHIINAPRYSVCLDL